MADIGFWHTAVATTATPDLARRQLLLDDISSALDAYHEVRVAYCRAPLGDETLDPALFPLARAIDELMMAGRSDAELAESLAPLHEAVVQHTDEIITAADALAAHQTGGEAQLDRLGEDADSYRDGVREARDAWEKQSEEDIAAVMKLILAFVARLDEEYGPKSKRNDRDFPTLWLPNTMDAMDIFELIFKVWLHGVLICDVIVIVRCGGIITRLPCKLGCLVNVYTCRKGRGDAHSHSPQPDSQLPAARAKGRMQRSLRQRRAGRRCWRA